MKKLYDKSPVLWGILFGQGLFLLFILFEFFVFEFWLVNSGIGVIVDSCIRVAFGVFLSAIYLKTENITLCMLLHAVWDIFVRIPNYFCVNIQEGALLDFIGMAQDVLEFGVFIIMAIIICIRYKPKTEDSAAEIISEEEAV